MSSSVSLEYLNDLNLFETEAYHYDLSANGATANVPLENVIYRLVSNGSTLSLYIGPNTDTVGSTGVMIDMKRTGQYDGVGIDSTWYDSLTLNTMTNFDSTMYGGSREEHIIRLRQRNPDTGNWDMCEIKTFASGPLSRVDVFVKWIGKNIQYETP